MVPRPPAKEWSLLDALNRRTAEPENEQACWLVDLSLNKPGGYPQLSIPMNFRRRPGETKRYAHALSYEHFCGPIPDGFEVDHLCEVHRCWNPNHLEAVPQPENRRHGADKTNARRADQPSPRPRAAPSHVG